MTEKKKQNQKDFTERLTELDNAYRRKREAYQQFVEYIQDYEPRTKADAWMAYTAGNLDTYCDQEALVYLRSRGHECKEEIDELVSDWKNAAKQQIDECARGIGVHILESGETQRIGSMPLSKASDVRNVSPYILSNFWGGRREQELSIDATMLRTVEWCDIGGFEEWWDRLARSTKQDIIQGGIDSIPGSYWLFWMLRSDYAIELVGKALERALEAIELPFNNEPYPWRVMREWNAEGQGKYCEVDHFPYASTIVFANIRLHPGAQDSSLVHKALENIIKAQNDDGAWPIWADAKHSSVEATAMCIHALALSKVRGWARSVSKAKNWLWSKQKRSGCWVESGSPDPVCLSVLVLDALDLVDGARSLTFGRQVSKYISSPSKIKRRFAVALSFPGEIRESVEPVANALARKLGHERVFYDRFFEAELARPNLDVYLQSIYHEDAEIVAVFLCSDYAKKEWCGLEWRVVRDLIKIRRDADLILFRTDSSPIPGLLSIDGYIDATDRSPDHLADLILLRLSISENRWPASVCSQTRNATTRSKSVFTLVKLRLSLLQISPTKLKLSMTLRI